MPAPAVTVETETTTPPRSLPTDTGVAYVTGFSATGPAGALSTEQDAITSHAIWLRRYGGGSVAAARIAWSVMSDWVEAFFKFGGNRLYFQRETGDTPVKASINLAGASGTTLVGRATEFGAFYSTTYKMSVTNGSDGSHRYVKLTAGADHPSTTDSVLAQTTNLSTRDDAVGQVLTDPVLGFKVAIEQGGGSGLPTVASSTALGGGADDHATADETNVAAAAALFPADLGPGQLAAPDHAGDSDVHLALMAAAPVGRRFGVLDGDDVDDTGKSTLTDNGGTLQGTVNGSRGAFYAPWVTIKALAAGGTDRRVPPSAAVCARTADTDARFNPNRAAAGIKDGVGVLSSFATGVGATFSRDPQGASDADDLSDAGVNLIILRRGQVVIYDDITLVDPAGDEANFLHVPNARYRMWTEARAQALGEGEQFDEVNWDTIQHFAVGLEGILKQDFLAGILVPETRGGPFSEAANVDVITPNDDDTMEAGQINANLAVRPARSARFINIAITAVGMTESVS
jgi:hypothetical protein